MSGWPVYLALILPAVVGVANLNLGAALLGGVLGSVGALFFIAGHHLGGGATWLAAWVLPIWLVNGRRRQRQEEIRHREMLKAVALAGSGTGAPAMPIVPRRVSRPRVLGPIVVTVALIVLGVLIVGYSR